MIERVTHGVLMTGDPLGCGKGGSQTFECLLFVHRVYTLRSFTPRRTPEKREDNELWPVNS